MNMTNIAIFKTNSNCVTVIPDQQVLWNWNRKSDIFINIFSTNLQQQFRYLWELCYIPFSFLTATARVVNWDVCNLADQTVADSPEIFVCFLLFQNEHMPVFLGSFKSIDNWALTITNPASCMIYIHICYFTIIITLHFTCINLEFRTRITVTEILMYTNIIV